MQTFWTRISYTRSMRDLDKARLGKQRLETMQILRNLLGIQECYPYHPIQTMWRGWEPELAVYGAVSCAVFAGAPHYGRDTMSSEFVALSNDMAKDGRGYRRMPPWADDLDVIRAMRSNLVRKDPVFYRKFIPGTPVLAPYLWPYCHEDGTYDLRLANADLPRLKSGERVLPAHLRGEVLTRDGEVYDGP